MKEIPSNVPVALKGQLTKVVVLHTSKVCVK